MSESKSNVKIIGDEPKRDVLKEFMLLVNKRFEILEANLKQLSDELKIISENLEDQ